MPSGRTDPTHTVLISPDNELVLAADLGLDQILIFRLDEEAARLTPHRQPFVRTPPGAGPRHLTFAPARGTSMSSMN